MVERLGRIAAVFNGEVKQVERVFARSLNDNGNLAFVCRTQSGTHALKVARLSLLALGHHEVACHLHHARANLAFAAAQPFDFFAAMLIPLLDAGEIRIGTITTRQILFIKSRVLADQVAISLVDVGE